MKHLPSFSMLVLLCLLVHGQGAFAQWAVVDAGDIAQNTITAVNSAKIAIDTGQQVINTYNVILNQIKQIENQVKNLQRLPQGLNFVQDISLFGSKVTGLLGQANTVSFELDQATKQFDTLYRQAATVASTGDILALRQQMLGARMEASSMAVQMQSVRQNLTDVYTRLCNLLSGSWGASGNLDSQQIAAQQQALVLSTLQNTQALHATAARLEAQRQAEEVVLEQLRLKHLQELNTPMAPYVGGNGKLVTYTW